MRTKINLLSLLLVVLMLSSCYKTEEDATLEDYDITLTYYDKDFKFDSYGTFLVRDSVQLLSNYLSDEEWESFYTSGDAGKIRNKIISEFKALGYTEVSDSENPDFMVNPVLTAMQQTDVVYYPGWWWGYPGYWGWYGGWYYKNTNYYDPYWGYYPSWGASYYTYKTGTLIIEMADGESVRVYRQWIEDNGEDGDPNDAPEIIFNWTAHVEGVMGSGTTTNEARLIFGIEEAFNQSPYLKK